MAEGALARWMAGASKRGIRRVTSAVGGDALDASGAAFEGSLCAGDLRNYTRRRYGWRPPHSGQESEEDTGDERRCPERRRPKRVPN